MHTSGSRRNASRGGSILSEKAGDGMSEAPAEVQIVTTTEDSTVTESTPSEAPKSPRKGARKTWSLVAKVISGMVAIVAAITGVVSIVQVMDRDTSGLNTLELTASAVASDTNDFVVVVSDLERFPASDQPCDATQLAWLSKNAEPFHHRFRVEMRNSASEGAMLALLDFRAELNDNDGVDSPIAQILVSCPAEIPATAVRSAALAVDESGATARFRPLRNTTQAQAAPDIPVSWNLAPGETGILDIELSAAQRSSGRLVVTALNGRDRSTVAIESSDFEVPGVWRHGEVYLAVGPQRMECLRATAGEPEECTADDIAELSSLYKALTFSTT